MFRTLWRTLAAVLLIFGGVAAPEALTTQAQGTGDTVYVGRSAVNLRAEASSRARRVARLAPGTAMLILNETEGQRVSGSTVWYQVDAGEHMGYVHSSLVTLTPPVSQPAAAQSAPGGQGSSPFGCNGQDDLNCSDFRAIGQSANAHIAACGDEDRLDADGDGRACER